MNKEKLMQFISEAVDKGAKIDILFHGHNISKEQAKEVCQQFNEIVGGEIQEKIYEDATWFKAETEKITLDHFYRNHTSHFMEEDINFEGDENIA